MANPNPTPTHHFLSSRHILISGAGMAGLSFTLALHKLWPPHLPPPRVTLLDRDNRQNALGREGYSLSLAGHDDTGGLYALKDLGLLDSALDKAILGAQGDMGGCFRVWDERFREVMSVRPKPAEGLPSAGIRIARRDLRGLLVDGVRDAGGEARWGVAAVKAETNGDGRVVVIVEGEGVRDGEERIECDLLVVADGGGSKIRRGLRPDDVLVYAGAVQMGGIASFPEGIPPPLDENWGMQLSGGQGVCCFYSPVDKKGVVWALSFLEPEARSKLGGNPSQEAADRVLEEARERGKILGPLFQRMVDATTEPASVFCLPARDKAPFRHDLDGAAIVFIGDSNHAVSPFAGYGASLALKDGWDLARKIVQAGSLRDAVLEYDAISEPRAVKVRGTSRWRIKYGHSTGVTAFIFHTLLAVMGYILWLTGRG
ncbi:hypothetical protein C8A05DRAFT_44931 [Staphylotrichum tortipilum]|uniref:FAD-binding domain-containing protein n=1 Tax=Staphylotrichum tortipilum TaxID=2831512 RepID=A0AAN6MJH6_9PEZI|nr:hypothetical protein C8A05DRAFT_44931 [Staphylotrichum longicolle]